MVIRVLTKLNNGREELGENFNKELASIIKNKAKGKNAITEMKNTLARINSILANIEK